MKTNNRVSAIIGNVQEYDKMGDLVENRPVATMPFGGKYRLIDFQLSAIANSDIHSVYSTFLHTKIQSVYDHVGSGREWGLDTILSRSFIGVYEGNHATQECSENYFDKIITYLKRSHSAQTVFMTSNILANIDLDQLILTHRRHDKKMTVAYKKMLPEKVSPLNTILELDEHSDVIGHRNFDAALDKEERVNMNMALFVVDTQWLIDELEKDYHTNAPISTLHFLMEHVEREKATAYEFTGHVANIYDVKSYYDANMEMLDPAVFNTLFFASNKIYTKVKNEAPTYYAPTSQVRNSQFASGSIIEGTVESSIISRNNVIKKSAIVKDSLILPNVEVSEGAVIEYAIVDKNTVIKNDVIIRGTKENPLVVKKGSVVTENIINEG